jgi:uncharacterized protein YuzE
MAIRLRTVNGTRIALCAAETDAMPGDIYLDDSDHYALSAKYADDWQGRTIDWNYPEHWKLMQSQKKRDAKEEIEKTLSSWDILPKFEHKLRYDILNTLIDSNIIGNYDQEADILQILFDKNAKTRIVHYLPDNEHCAILFDIDNNNQVVGLHIENFSYFIKGQGDI